MTMITIFVSDQIRTQFFLVVISDNVTHEILSGKTFANWYSKGRHWVKRVPIFSLRQCIGPGGQNLIHVQKNVEIVNIFLERFTFLKKAIYGLDMPLDYFICGWMKACAIWWGFCI